MPAIKTLKLDLKSGTIGDGKINNIDGPVLSSFKINSGKTSGQLTITFNILKGMEIVDIDPAKIVNEDPNKLFIKLANSSIVSLNCTSYGIKTSDTMDNAKLTLEFSLEAKAGGTTGFK